MGRFPSGSRPFLLVATGWRPCGGYIFTIERSHSRHMWRNLVPKWSCTVRTGVLIMIDYLVSGPTVDLWVKGPTRWRQSDGAWGAIPAGGLVASELVYSARELVAVLRTYGEALGRLLMPVEAPNFILTATSVASGCTLGQYQWRWSANARCYVPAADAMCVWDEQMRRAGSLAA